MAPEVTTINHVGLTVRDIDASKRWYTELLGFEAVREMAQDGYKLAILERVGVAFSIGLFEFETNPGEEFDPHRTGMNHLAFTVQTRPELDEWLHRLDGMQIKNSGIQESINGWILTFRDPDSIALEVYTDYGDTGKPSH